MTIFNSVVCLPGGEKCVNIARVGEIFYFPDEEVLNQHFVSLVEAMKGGVVRLSDDSKRCDVEIYALCYSVVEKVRVLRFDSSKSG